MEIDAILRRFERFGIHMGLERIQQLLADLGNPHYQVPIIHVTGSNGKGSVCAYLSAVLTEAGYRVGRYTSPHLVDWCERICLNEQPISPLELERLLAQVQAVIQPGSPSPTQFEVITAAAWLYFAQAQVDVAVVEVGLGGRLDATNVCDRPLVSIITNISLEHAQQLGPTLADIAREKAGIFKQGCPVVVGSLPPEAQAVVRERIADLNCPVVWTQPARQLQHGWAEYQGIKYPLPLQGDFQLSNSAIAIAALQILQKQSWQILEQAIVQGMAKTKWLGRIQWTSWKNHTLLLDGAHNPAAAQALRQFVDSHDTGDHQPKPVHWVIGMFSDKDKADILAELLRPGDQLYLVPLPMEPWAGRTSANLHDLASLAQSIIPDLSYCQVYPDLFAGLEAAIATAITNDLIVLCGSLYLVGHFLQNSRVR